MARAIRWAREEGNKQVQARTGIPILIDSEELRTPSPNKLHFRRRWRDTVSFRNAMAVSSPPSITQMQQVWHHRTAQRGARPLGETFELGKDTVSLHDLRTCCNWLALYVLGLLLETPLKLVPPPGFLLQLLVGLIPVPVKTSFYMTCNLPTMMATYPLAF
jgi:hypothetical protein